MARTDNFEVRLAENQLEIEAAQRLRYDVFYTEMGARPTPSVRLSGRDEDEYDYCCDHLLVIDRARSNGPPFVVGTYRMMRKHAALSNGGFYSSQEFDLSALIQSPVEMVEVGRSCVHQDYRRGAAMALLWRGIADYIREREIGLLFGCASFTGTTDSAVLTEELAYLYHHHLAPEAMRPRALDDRYVKMDALNTDQFDGEAILARMPALVKGYLRLGGAVGDGAVIDYEFNTVDVCIIVETSRLAAKYQHHYKPSGRP